MSKQADFDKDFFLQTGALFAKGDWVWLLWGTPQQSAHRPDGVAIFKQNFMAEESPLWQSYPYVLKIDREQALALFTNKVLSVAWQPLHDGKFKQQFDLTTEQFKQGSLQKAVPYCFEKGTLTDSPSALESLLASVLKNKNGFTYGCWSDSQGFVGLSPEILISQSAEKTFDTMALAGTCDLQTYRQNPQAFLQDSKEVDEHRKVVEDIMGQLSQWGQVEASPMTVKETPHLAHLFTALSLRTLKPVALMEIVNNLHPTPALGCFPRGYFNTVMQAFDKIEPRGVFGAPFGITYSRHRADVIVAIRGLFWDKDEIKLGAGCGVVPQSHFAREWKELSLKRQSVKKIFGVQ